MLPALNNKLHINCKSIIFIKYKESLTLLIVWTKTLLLSLSNTIVMFLLVFVYLIGLWDSSKLVSSTDFKNFSRYLLRNFEEKEAKIRVIAAINITQTVIITDFYGPNIIKHLCSKCLRVWPEISQQTHSHYPQQTYRAYFINSK